MASSQREKKNGKKPSPICLFPTTVQEKRKGEGKKGTNVWFTKGGKRRPIPPTPADGAVVSQGKKGGRRGRLAYESEGGNKKTAANGGRRERTRYLSPPGEQKKTGGLDFVGKRGGPVWVVSE